MGSAVVDDYWSMKGVARRRSPVRTLRGPAFAGSMDIAAVARLVFPGLLIAIPLYRHREARMSTSGITGLPGGNDVGGRIKPRGD